MRKPHLSMSRILQMNFGFLGLQFSFGLQQGNMGPIYSYLGAEESQLPILLLAGPLTGLLVQPIVGAMSDRTLSRWGRRTPYFVAGAIMCSVGLLFMPFSSSLMMAVSMLWLMDVGNNTTMEPYRAYVSDRLNPDQHQVGYLSQSAFTGLAQMLAFLTPSLLVWFGMNQDWVDSHNIPYTARIAFLVGAGLSLTTIMYSIMRVPELPLTDTQKAHIEAQPKGVVATFAEIGKAIVEMPVAMRKLGLMSLFQWYAMAAYWGYVIYSIGRSVYGTADATSSGFHSAVLSNGEMAAFYNGIAFLAAFAMVPLSKRIGAGIVHAICLTLGGIGMLVLPEVSDKWLLFLPAIGIGLAWGSIMGNPYIILAGSIPEERTGVYMGIFNMMIVIPMLLLAATLPFAYDTVLEGDPRNVLRLAGVLMVLAALSVLWVKEGWRQPAEG
ncbi:MFS transporter [Pseudomonadales bacterium]|uniref:MFS transporter n=1 Tax=Reinekea sp. TaxID=1970455 RepID=UPI002325FACF|nr:MFS transporter [Reinekea sp.]MDA9285462.1 MFS transporter [Pseudomonadales bacterium]MDA9298208.1 MFS transporter [Pseudomonadales bacterium]MDB4151087.1 MFS transporter [Pseudomonadales bacterium]MDB9868535.1 MFS transporter [Pseudomonadales bacterium]MDB9879431.1 MFS transporter [Pseudomonadales bacterium]